METNPNFGIPFSKQDPSILFLQQKDSVALKKITFLVKSDSKISKLYI